MTSPEAFNEQELFALFDAEEQSKAETEKTNQQYEIIHERLWSAIETLEIDTACGPDPAEYEQEYDVLVDVLLATVEGDLSAEDRALAEQYVHARAQDIWDNDCKVIATIALAIEAQLFPTPETTAGNLIKKTLTANLAAKGVNTERWLPLIDYVLEGEPLDPTSSEDMDIIAQALETEANADNTPEAELYNTLLTVLGVPEPETAIDDPIEFQKLNYLTLAARDLTELTYYLPGETEQPNRHEKLHQVLREYNVTDESAIEIIFQLTDSFVRAD